jgi:hypothetical protein
MIHPSEPSLPITARMMNSFLRATLAIFCGLFLWPGSILAQDNQAKVEPPRLDGAIIGAEDQPLTNAWVSVFSAAPRDGQRTTIPIKHYPECGRFTRTDAQGNFAFTGLNQNLLYRLLVTAPGHRPDYIRDADPQFGGTALKLRRLRFTNGPPARRVIGNLIDPSGRPVAGARIEVNGYRSQTTTYNSSPSGNVDPLAVTDQTGGFFLDCGSNVEAISVTVEGPRLAPRRLWLTAGSAHLIRLHPGATITGRVLHSGKPMPATLITMDTEDQTSAVYIRGLEVATDDSGRFTLIHVPAETKFSLYTPMKDLEDIGAGVAKTAVTTSTNDGVLDLGDLAMRSAHILRGRVLLSDGQPVPERIRITLALGPGTNNRSSVLDADGWFEFAGVPAGPVSLRVQIPGYRVSARNPSKDWLNEGRLVGTLKEDHERFFIELEPGQRTEDSAGPPDGPDRQPQDKPLRTAPIEG